MTVSILGCGWFGMSLAKLLLAQNITVKASTTTQSKLAHLKAAGTEAFLVNIQSPANSIIDPVFFDCDTLVIANNVKMASQEEHLIRAELTLSLIRRHAIKKVVFISSTSVYGDPNSIV